MMSVFENKMKMLAQQAMSANAGNRIGQIDGFDPNSYTAKVKIMPEGTLTGWLPIKSAWVGNGWGMLAPPSIGDWCDVEYHDGDEHDGKVGDRYFNDTDRPLPAPSGEFWLVHKTGSCLKFTNDGKILVSSTAEIDVTAPTVNVTATTSATVNAPTVNVFANALNITATTIASMGSWAHQGIMSISGLLTMAGGFAASGGSGSAGTINGDLNVNGGDVLVDGISSKTHTHGGVQGGISNTALPNP